MQDDDHDDVEPLSLIERASLLIRGAFVRDGMSFETLDDYRDFVYSANLCCAGCGEPVTDPFQRMIAKRESGEIYCVECETALAGDSGEAAETDSLPAELQGLEDVEDFEDWEEGDEQAAVDELERDADFYQTFCLCASCSGELSQAEMDANALRSEVPMCNECLKDIADAGDDDEDDDDDDF